MPIKATTNAESCYVILNTALKQKHAKRNVYFYNCKKILVTFSKLL